LESDVERVAIDQPDAEERDGQSLGHPRTVRLNGAVFLPCVDVAAAEEHIGIYLKDPIEVSVDFDAAGTCEIAVTRRYHVDGTVEGTSRTIRFGEAIGDVRWCSG